MSTVASMKGGNLFIESVDVPDAAVKPNGSVRTNVTVGNGALLIIDDDGCEFTPGGYTGYFTRLNVDPEWTAAAAREECVNVKTNGIGRWSTQFTFSAPSQPGFYTIQFWIETPNTGGVSQKVTRTVEVASDGQTDPDPGGDDGGDGGDGDPDGGGLENLIDRLAELLGLADAARTTKWAVLFALFLVTVYVLGTLFDVQIGGGS